MSGLLEQACSIETAVCHRPATHAAESLRYHPAHHHPDGVLWVISPAFGGLPWTNPAYVCHMDEGLTGRGREHLAWTAHPAERSTLWVSVAPRPVLRLGLALAVLLAALSLTGRVLTAGADPGGLALAYRGVMDVDREGSIPSFYSAVMLLACAASLWTVADAVRRRGQRWERHWQVLAIAFVYLSIDEMVSLHERVIEPLREALDLGGVLYYSWVLVAVPLVIGFGLALVPFLRALPRWTAVAFLLSGAVYVGGAAGMEMVGGLIASSGGEGTLPLHAVVTFEELLEMVGITLFLASVNEHRLRYLTPSPVRGAADEPTDDAPSPVTDRR